MRTYNKYKKLYQKDQENIKSFDKLYRRSLQDNLIDGNEYNTLCNIFLLDETKMIFCYVSRAKSSPWNINVNIKIQLNRFNDSKKKFIQPST